MSRDYLAQEMKLGREAARRLRQEIIRGAFQNYNVGQTRYNTKDGRRIKGLPKELSMGKTKVNAVKENNELNALRITISRHAMILNFGYERTYSNGTRMRMEGSEFVTEAVYGRAISDLANRIAELRADMMAELVAPSKAHYKTDGSRFENILRYHALESAKRRL